MSPFGMTLSIKIPATLVELIAKESVQKLSAAEETISDTKSQCYRFSCTLRQELHFHKMTPKSTEFLHMTSYFKTQVQKARTGKLGKTAEKNNTVLKGF